MKVLLAATLAVAVLAAPAAANVPDPLTQTNPLHIPWTGSGTNGTLTTEVTYSDTTASATASTGDTISLGKGFVFHLRTCVAYHLATTVPVSSCDERTVDTRQSTGPVSTHAPTVTLSGQPRPTTQPWGYFTPYAEVLYESGGSTQVIAQSWPDEGLQGAGVAVAAQGQTTGTLPANSTLTLDGPYTSAINAGQPDSICAAGTTPGIYGPVRPGVRTSHPAFADAPAYYEVGPPTGDHAGQTPRGVMLLIHGGGWWVGGVEGVGSMRDDAERWRARGWETVSFSYRACGQSLGDALWFHDKARSWFGAGAKICSMGTSAGGQLSLLIGANRRGLACIVSIAGPTDLSRIQNERVYNSANGLYDSTFGSRLVHNLGAAAFGEENLATYSPATQASATLKSTRVLQAFSADDYLVPFQQAADLGEAMSAANPAAYVDNVQLAIGTIHFGHGAVTQAALDDFYAREERLVAPITGPPAALAGR
jgi:acetyl esterase/lipase/opacity protein-like surface antigen